MASAGVGGVAGPAVSGSLTQHLGLASPLLAGAAAFAAITVALGWLRVPPGPAAARTEAAGGLRAAARDRAIIGAAAAVVVEALLDGPRRFNDLLDLLNVIWAATAVLGPLAAGLAAEHLSVRAAFGLTEAACAAALAVTVALARPARRPMRTVPGHDLAHGGVLLRSGSRDHGGAS